MHLRAPDDIRLPARARLVMPVYSVSPCAHAMCRLCGDITAVISKASMCSSLRGSVIAALQQVPPDSVVPAAELLITQCLPDPSGFQQSGLPKAVGSILGLLLNVTHQSKDMSLCCGSPVPLLHLARSLHVACSVLARSRPSPAPDDGNAELVSFIGPLICLLINVVEHSAEASVQLAQMDMTSAVTAPRCTLPGTSGSDPAFKDLVNPVETDSACHAPCKQDPVQSAPAEVHPGADFHNAVFDDFRAKEDDLLLMSASQASGLHSGRLSRSGSARLRRTSASSSAGSKPRHKKRHSLTAVRSPTNTSPATVTKVRLHPCHQSQAVSCTRLDPAPPHSMHVGAESQGFQSDSVFFAMLFGLVVEVQLLVNLQLLAERGGRPSLHCCLMVQTLMN